MQSAATRVAFTVAIALVPGCMPGCKKATPPEVEVTVQAAHPESGSIAEHVTADAILAPLAQAAVAPKITAPVKKFYVQRGARVKAGELLVELENSDLNAAVLDNEGTYEAAQAAYDIATKAQVPEDTLKAESDLAEAKANFDLNKSIVESRKQLLAEGAIPGRDLDTAQAVLVQAQAAYDAAAKHLDSVRSVSRDAALKAAKGQLTSAQGKYDGAQAQESYSEIRSPIDGTVTDRPLFAGETAAAGAALVTVMDTSSLIAKTHIAQGLAQQLKVGGEAAVQVPGISDPVPAKVAMISPALDSGSTTVEVWLKIDNKAGTLKVGTPVKVSITGTTIAQAWKIPLSSIITGTDSSKSVMVIGGDGVAHIKPVTLGIDDGTNVQVLTGLSPTDTVITGGGYGLDDGTKVKVGPAGDSAKVDAGGSG
jgi:multidrug efflux pump subunit AcrA (membrane-fusion protein)